MARYFGGSFWRIIVAHLFGGFFIVNETGGFQRKKRKAKIRTEMYNQ
jgi:hypothetical protein